MISPLELLPSYEGVFQYLKEAEPLPMYPLVTSKMLVRYVNLSVFPDSFPKKCMNQVSGFKFIKSVDYFDSKFNSKPVSIFGFNDPFPIAWDRRRRVILQTR